MSHYFSTTVLIAGKHEDIANFHTRLMAKEGAQPSGTFKFERLAFDRDGRTNAVAYKAGQSRYPPTAENFAFSDEAADIPVVTQISRHYEDGTSSVNVFFGRTKLYEALDVYCLGEVDDTSVPPEVTAADKSFADTAREKFGVLLPATQSPEAAVSY